MKKTIYLIILVMSTCGLTSAQTFENIQKDFCKKQITSGFIENKGQILNQDGKPASEIVFMSYSKGMNIQLHPNSFSYDTYSETANGSKSKFHFHRVDIELIHTNKNPEVIASGESVDYTNYYNVPVRGGVHFVRSYKSVTYKNIYNGIDIEFKLNDENKPEYNFIIYPNADVSQIKLKYSGAPVKLINRALSIKTSNGMIEETIPSSWYKTNDGTITQIAMQYIQLSKKVFGFKTENTIPLFAEVIIDPVPNRVWGTYFGHVLTGQNTDDKIWSMAIDAAGDVYVTGQTNSPSPAAGIATTGAYQFTWGGNASYDAFVEKFNGINGARIYGTYYGGSGQDYGTAIKVDALGNVYLAGSTCTDTIGVNENVISTPGSYQSRYYGFFCSLDGFLVKFNSTGQRIWGTYYGGEYGATRIYSMAISQDNQNVYFYGITQSDSAYGSQPPYLMYAPGAFQTHLNGGQDNFIAQFDSSGSRIWGTYFGGNGLENVNGNYIEQGGSIVIDSLNNIFICGATDNATNFPILNSFFSFGGMNDGYFAKFDATHNLVFSSFLGGSQADIAFDLVFKNSSLYVLGCTYTANFFGYPNGFPIHDTTYNSDQDVFLAKFDVSTPSPIMTWSTYYGGSGKECAWRMNMDSNSNLILTGYTDSQSGIATPNSYQPVQHVGAMDAYVAKFDTNGIQKWGTYFGGLSLDESNSVVTDMYGNVYIAGLTASDTDIGFGANVYMLNYGGGFSGNNTDGFIAKFDSTNVISNVSNLINQSDVSVFPNPTNDFLNIQTTTLTKENIEIEVRSISGQLILSKEIKPDRNYLKTQINIQSLAKGTYTVSMKTDKQVIHSLTFIKQ